MHAETFGAVAHGRVLEAEAGGAAQRVEMVQVEEAQLAPGQQVRSAAHSSKGGCGERRVCVSVCVDTDLSQLKPSTLSLQRHCPVVTSHS